MRHHHRSKREEEYTHSRERVYDSQGDRWQISNNARERDSNRDYFLSPLPNCSSFLTPISLFLGTFFFTIFFFSFLFFESGLEPSRTSRRISVRLGGAAGTPDPIYSWSLSPSSLPEEFKTFNGGGGFFGRQQQQLNRDGHRPRCSDFLRCKFLPCSRVEPLLNMIAHEKKKEILSSLPLFFTDSFYVCQLPGCIRIYAKKTCLCVSYW